MKLWSKYLLITVKGNFTLSFVSKDSLLIGILIDIVVSGNQRRCEITKIYSSMNPVNIAFLGIVLQIKFL